MLKTLFVSLFASALFASVTMAPAYAHHTPVHRALVLNEESSVTVRLLVCRDKEDADSILVANEEGGSESTRAKAQSLQSLRHDDGTSRCLIVGNAYVTPLAVYRRTSITVESFGEFVRSEATLMKVRVRSDDGFSGVYFSPFPMPVVESGVHI